MKDSDSKYLHMEDVSILYNLLNHKFHVKVTEQFKCLVNNLKQHSNACIRLGNIYLGLKKYNLRKIFVMLSNKFSVDKRL